MTNMIKNFYEPGRAVRVLIMNISRHHSTAGERVCVRVCL